MFELVQSRFNIDHVGIDLDEEHVRIAANRYGDRRNFRVIHGSAADSELLLSQKADVVIALEPCEHIPERDVVRIVEWIAEMRPICFVCSVPVEIGPAIWLKNLGSALLLPHGIGHKGFDWRWLAQTIRHNLQITKTARFPSNLLPAGLSTTAFFIASPR